ncbi:MAG: nucleoside monophosphate kinase [Candidatus Portiera sp.]|nr:nucleoside monophosphate kinase [Portiera sp.]
MNIILLGPPGSGKGTQAEILSNDLGIAHISTGNILRQEIEEQTDLGKLVARTMQAGDLVDDETILAVTIKTLKSPEYSKGFILDGVPRSLAQAQGLKNNNIEINHVIDMLCSDEEVIQRITNRRVHPASGRIYNTLSNPPRVTDKDDETGEDLVQRDDDKEETVRKRLQNYNEITSPLKDYYREMANNDPLIKYHQLDADKSPQSIAEYIKHLL